MFELLFCATLTILPDYLIRRYVQNKRIGREITLFTVWYELRYGIVTCFMLTVSLITLIFYFHPTAVSATLVFRTIPILPETAGRVEEVYFEPGLQNEVKAGDPIFRLDSSRQKADVDTKTLQVAEIEAELKTAEGELAVAASQVDQAKSALKQATDELDTKTELRNRNQNVVSEREVEKLATMVDSRKGALAAAMANQDLVTTKIEVVLPAKLKSLQAQLHEAEIELGKMTVYAGVDGSIDQFTLRVGDIVNPLLRPAGVLIPADAGRGRMIASFAQIEAQVIKPGMFAEAVCSSLPFTVIPMIVTEVQPHISSGQIRASDQLIDAARQIQPGTITTFLEPLYPGGLDKVAPGSQCVANAYTSNHERLSSDPSIGTGEFVLLHAIDAVGLVHAMLLRLQAILFPVQTLVLTGH